MTRLTERAYRDERDLAPMLAMVTRAAETEGAAVGHLHPGDVVWGFYRNLTIDPAARIRLFEDGDGTLRAFAWLNPPRAFTLHLDASWPLDPEEIADIVRATEAHLEPGAPFTTDGPSPDARLRAGFAVAGYRETGGAAYQLNSQALDGEPPAPVLPPGAVVRPVRLDDPVEVAARVALHQEVWESQTFTAEGYARLRGMPVYRPELDLVAVTPAGELAAYTILWWDPVTRTGELEPVGTSPRFRRQGYGQALLLDGLARLQALGAVRANVISETDEDAAPARALYAAVGFARVLRYDDWARDATG